MNKKYNDFSTETPYPDRIILHADPSTGELKKCPISAIVGTKVTFVELSGNTGSIPTIQNQKGSPLEISLTYADTGLYILQLPIDEMTESAIVSFSNAGNSGTPVLVGVYRISFNEWQFATMFTTGAYTDEWQNLILTIAI